MLGRNFRHQHVEVNWKISIKLYLEEELNIEGES